LNTTETRYLYDGTLPVQERDKRNNVINEYTYGLGLPGGIGGLLHLNQEGAHYAYLYDGKGNVAALLDGAGNAVQTYQYDPFGVPKPASGSVNQPTRFSTNPYDTETGLSYYGYRFYAPNLGRWMTRDPIGEAGGINLYGFVGNNPANFIDPDGDHPAWVVGTAVVLTGYFLWEIFSSIIPSFYRKSN
jgi:RHS repeat-associated protein